ncbi:MAG: protein-L-isoaspartate(D-aspartate) O-methyltransferase [Armatimonadetes bacterium]|nr:protein-L-isoaspartate(D-aspartate) O-methyltransferase [Armatimonadota bacterium]
MRAGLYVPLAVGAVAVAALAWLAGAQPVAEADYAQQRNRMVDMLVRMGYVSDERVIKALRSVPRHLFVPSSLRSEAYVDTPLPIGHDQTISAPSIVAKMTELLEPKPDHVVLEIGTGSGYQAAVLAELVRHVYTIEIIPELAESARKRLQQLGYKNVTVKCGDGYRGWPEHAPFDGIIVTCAPTDIPQPLVEQLKEGGRMVIPVGELWAQELYLLVKEHGRIVKRAVLPVVFVPMTGEAQKRR